MWDAVLSRDSRPAQWIDVMEYAAARAVIAYSLAKPNTPACSEIASD